MYLPLLLLIRILFNAGKNAGLYTIPGRLHRGATSRRVCTVRLLVCVRVYRLFVCVHVHVCVCVCGNVCVCMYTELISFVLYFSFILTFFASAGLTRDTWPAFVDQCGLAITLLTSDSGRTMHRSGINMQKMLDLVKVCPGEEEVSMHPWEGGRCGCVLDG